jgi:hypothetical protein
MIETTLIATLACLFGHAATVIAILNARVRLAPVLLHAISGLAWHCVAIAILLAFGTINYYWHSAAFFGLGIMTYVFGFSAVYKSVSLRTLVFIAQSPLTTTTVNAIHEQVVMHSFRKRADLLTQSGLIALGPDGYVLTCAGRKIARRISIIRRLLGVESSGLYYEKNLDRIPK